MCACVCACVHVCVHVCICVYMYVSVRTILNSLGKHSYMYSTHTSSVVVSISIATCVNNSIQVHTLSAFSTIMVTLHTPVKAAASVVHSDQLHCSTTTTSNLPSHTRQLTSSASHVWLGLNLIVDYGVVGSMFVASSKGCGMGLA